MIQRIQSLFLLLAAVLAVVVVFLPIGTVALNEYAEYAFSAFTLKAYKPGGEIGAPVMHTTYIAVLWFASAILSLVTIFMYKNRQLQVRLNGINMLIMLAALVVMLYVYPNLVFAHQAWYQEGMDVVFNRWILLALVPAVCLYLANWAIKRDEKKVRAADCLR